MNLSKLFALGAEELKHSEEPKPSKQPFVPCILVLRLMPGEDLGHAERLKLCKTVADAEAYCAGRDKDPVGTLYLFLDARQRLQSFGTIHDREYFSDRFHEEVDRITGDGR